MPCSASAACGRGCSGRSSASSANPGTCIRWAFSSAWDFDTATEIAVLGISAAESAKGLPFYAVMIFPALFAAGMALVDTTDSVLMVGAYGWAFVEPMRKLFYNFTITLVSVVVAVVVGGIEALGFAADRLGFDGPFWRLVTSLNENFAGIGYAVIVFFLAAWLGSALVWRLRFAGKTQAAKG